MDLPSPYPAMDGHVLLYVPPKQAHPEWERDMPKQACPVSTADGTRPVREHAPDGLEPTLPDVCCQPSRRGKSR